MLTRTLTTSKGHQFETDLTDQQAYAIASKDQSDFSQSLTSRPLAKLSESQLIWVLKIAHDITSRDRRREVESIDLKGDFGAFHTMMENAGKHLKWPKVRIMSSETDEILLKPRGEVIYVVDANRVNSEGRNYYYGKIVNGHYETINPPAWVVKCLEASAKDPIEEAKRYGKLTGNCCFCGRKLTSEDSTGVGYGPVCADRYGLEWGKKAA